jgi:hypothetical protein
MSAGYGRPRLERGRPIVFLATAAGESWSGLDLKLKAARCHR